MKYLILALFLFGCTTPVEDLDGVVSNLFNDLFECTDYNKEVGESCQCFDKQCASHVYLEKMQGHKINPNGL